jgi:hypothetical protein
MIQHLIWLRKIDADYARDALATYLALPNCPCPEISDDLRRVWNSSQGSKDAIKKPGK